jgi:glycosyltransferase involved in cell wall biosynthesis
MLANVRKHVPDALLVFIGDAPESDMAFLKSYAADAGLERQVIFTGRMSREHALKLARHASVCVSTFPPHPLNDSTTPTKLVEYLALGRPVVVNDHADQTNVVEKSGAGLSVPYEVEPFAAAVAALLLDPTRAEAMGARGPAFVRDTRATAVLAARVDETYRALLPRSHASVFSV